MDTVTGVEIRPVEEPAALYKRYPGEHQPQPVALRLDLEHGVLDCDYAGAVGAIQAREHNRVVLTTEIPPLTAAYANALMEEVAPIAERVMAGATVEAVDGDERGRLTEAASAAWDELVAVAVAWASDPGTETVGEVNAREWLEAPSDVPHLGAATTDEQLATMVADLEAQIARTVPGVVVVTHAEEALRATREQLRAQAKAAVEAARDRVEEIKARHRRELADVVQLRDSAVAAAEFEPSRVVAPWAGISHSAVADIWRAARHRRAGHIRIEEVRDGKHRLLGWLDPADAEEYRPRLVWTGRWESGLWTRSDPYQSMLFYKDGWYLKRSYSDAVLSLTSVGWWFASAGREDVIAARFDPPRENAHRAVASPLPEMIQFIRCGSRVWEEGTVAREDVIEVIEGVVAWAGTAWMGVHGGFREVSQLLRTPGGEWVELSGGSASEVTPEEARRWLAINGSTDVIARYWPEVGSAPGPPPEL